MKHLGLATARNWDRAEYADGFRARLTAIPSSDAAHHCWRTGWGDANTEMLEAARHRRVVSEMPPLLLVLWREKHPGAHE